MKPISQEHQKWMRDNLLGVAPFCDLTGTPLEPDSPVYGFMLDAGLTDEWIRGFDWSVSREDVVTNLLAEDARIADAYPPVHPFQEYERGYTVLGRILDRMLEESSDNTVDALDPKMLVEIIISYQLISLDNVRYHAALRAAIANIITSDGTILFSYIESTDIVLLFTSLFYVSDKEATLMLTREERQEFREKLKLAFSRVLFLERMIYFRIGSDIYSEVNFESSLEDVVFQLIIQAERKYLTDRVLIGAFDENKSNIKLAKFIADIIRNRTNKYLIPIYFLVYRDTIIRYRKAEQNSRNAPAAGPLAPPTAG